MSPEERYLHDAQFRMLVDMLEKQIHDCQYTPTELREAAILAAIHYESRRIIPARVKASIGRAEKDNLERGEKKVEKINKVDNDEI